MDLSAYLARKRELVELALEKALPQPEGPTARLYQAMRYSLLAGGKRLRPILCLAGTEAVGGRVEAAMPAALALEMVHTYSLIHDDLPAMDDDELRRGRPSNHMVFGEGLAVLAGDGLLTFGLGLLARAAADGLIPAERASAALGLIADAAGPQGMVGGQAADMEAEGRPITPEGLDFIHNHKTAALIAASVMAGGILGGGSQESVRKLGDYGRNIGLAFQIIDDILDIQGDEAELGKPVGSDQARAKATYPAIFGLEQARIRASELIDRALANLNDFDQAAEPLRALARYFLERKK